MRQLLPDGILRTDDDAGSGAGTLYECRHCGSKFDEDRTRCGVCGAAEIATYTFVASSEDGDS